MNGRLSIYVNHLSQAAKVEDGVSFACDRQLYRDAIDKEWSDFASSKGLPAEERDDHYFKWTAGKLDEREIAREREICSRFDPDFEQLREDFPKVYKEDALDALGSYRGINKPYQQGLLRMPVIDEGFDSKQKEVKGRLEDHLKKFAAKRWDEHVEKYVVQEELPPEAKSSLEIKQEVGAYHFNELDLIELNVPQVIPENLKFQVRGRPDYVIFDDKTTIGEIKTGSERGRKYDELEVFSYMISFPEPLENLRGELNYAPDGPTHLIEPEKLDKGKIDEFLIGILDAVIYIHELGEEYKSAAEADANPKACWNCDFNNPSNKKNSHNNQNYGCPADE